MGCPGGYGTQQALTPKKFLLNYISQEFFY